jgi:hypothetical protein
MKANLFDTVILTDGRSGTVSQVFGDPALHYEVQNNNVVYFGNDDIWIVEPHEIKEIL